MMSLGGTVEAHLPGLKYPTRRLSNGFAVQPVHWSDNPEHDEAWADRESIQYGGRASYGWLQNMEMELVRGGSPRWPMLDRKYHVRLLLRRDYLNADWSVYRSLDHGIRHPECCAWVAVHRNRDRYFYRQFYQTNTGIPVVAKQIQEATGADEQVEMTVADPSIWRRDDVDAQTLWADIYSANGLTLVKADNSAAGYETVAAGFMATIARWALGHGDVTPVQEALNAPTLTMGDVEKLADQPAIWFHPSCAEGDYSLFEQCRNLRYKAQTGDPQHKAASELVEDVDDEGPDVVRYAMQSACVAWTVPRPRTQGEMVHRLFEQAAAKQDSGEVY